MDKGLLYSLMTGCVWACVACGYSAAARRKLAITPFVAIAATSGGIVSAIFTVHWSALSLWREAVPAALMISASGIVGQSCMVFSGSAMAAAPEHSAATWTIMQTAMIIPFVAAAASGREHAAWYNWLALPVILLAFRGLSPEEEQKTNPSSSRRLWISLLLVAFFLSGISQALAQEISLRNWSDVLNVRAALSLNFGGVFLWAVSALRRECPTRMHWIIGCVTGIVVSVGNIILFPALDLFAAAGRSYLVFPMAVGSSILAFALYQLARGRENWSGKKAVGLACGLAGIALLGLKQ